MVEDWRGRLRTAFRRHERRWMVGYLLAVSAVVAVIGMPALRAPALTAVNRVLDRADARWDRRLRHGETLVAEGRFEEAAVYLSNLDSIFPARTVQAGRDREKERLLAALALSQERLGRGGRALDAYRRLAAFDPRNWRNHYTLALATERIEGGWAIPEDAADAYRAVLAIHPNHLPSVRGLMQYYVDGGRFDGAMAVWDAYLDALMLQLLYLYVGDQVVEVNIRVDGRPQTVEVPVSIPPHARRVEIHTSGFSLRVDDTGAVAAQAVGVATPADTVPLTVVGSWSAGMTEVAGVLRADAAGSVVVLSLPDLPYGADRLRLQLTLFKPLDADTWDLARRSYRNVLRQGDLEAVSPRLLVHPDQARMDTLQAIPG